MKLRIPRSLDHKYDGYGSGIVRIDKSTKKIIDFCYTDSNLNPTTNQNMVTINKPGQIVQEDETSTTFTCNFSSYTIFIAEHE